MGRLIDMSAALLAYVCVATILAAGLCFGYGWTTGAIRPEQFEQILAILHGVDLQKRPVDIPNSSQPVHPEQPSLEAVAEARAVRSGDLELRETILRDMLSELKKLQVALEKEKDRFEKYRISVRAQLADEAAQARQQGIREFQSLVESMKPKQAKEQLLLKHKVGKIDLVVDVLRGMDETKRAKIIAEFKTPEDANVLSEVLEKIRLNPKLPLIEAAQKSLDADLPKNP